MLDLPLADMVGHMREEAPNECIGLVFDNGVAHRLINQARSSKRFFVGQSQVAEALQGKDHAVVATYHSHPRGKPTPSGEDEQFMAFLHLVWPKVIHVILSESGHAAYHVNEDLEIEEHPCPTLTPS